MAIKRTGQQADFHFQIDGGPVEKLKVARFEGMEAISRPFWFRLELASLDAEIKLGDQIGKPALLTIHGPDAKRYLHGIVLRMEQLGSTGKFSTYEAIVVPEIWLMSFRSRSRIFQTPSQTVQEIVKKVLDGDGLASDRYKFSLRATYPAREYCVQYRESDFNFISRLLEEEGIFYFFEHTKDGHVLVMADANEAMAPIPGTARLRFRPPDGQIAEKEHLLDFRMSEEFRSGKSSLQDYFYEKPAVSLAATEQAELQADYEVYDYPGGYIETPEGKRLAKTRLEELRATRVQGVVGSSCRRIDPGYRFEMFDHPRADCNGEYVAMRIQHEASQPQVREEESGEDKETYYRSTVEFFPSATPFRPDRISHKPVVRGSQTALVVGKSGEKVYMDELGRAKVQFYWDRDGKKDESSSCWVRVSQGYAGPTHGIQFPPLIGDEVIVDFLEGDPDRPIITGRVYNGTNKPPLKPDDRIQNVFLTPYQHRLMLDDKKASITLNTGGSETVYLGDEKEDQDFGNNVKISTKDGHFFQLAKGNTHKGLMIQTESKHKIEARDDPDPGIFLVDMNGSIYLHLDTQNKTINVINDEQGEINIKVAGGKVNVAGAEITIDAEQKVTIKAGSEIKIEAPKIVIDAQQELQAKAGMNAKVEAGMNLELKGGMGAKVEGGATAEVKGGAMTTIKGGIVMIN